MRDHVRMTALIPAAATALDNASRQFESAGARLIDATSGEGDGDVGGALIDMIQAKTQYRAALRVIQFSNEMWDALLDIDAEPRR